MKPQRKGPADRKGSAAAPWLTGLNLPSIEQPPRAPSPHASKPAGPGAPATGHQPRTERGPLLLLHPKSHPTLIPEGRVSITHGATNVGRVVDAGGPFVSAVAVCGDEPVLLGVSGAAVDLVLPAGLRRTFYPRAAREMGGYLQREATFLPLAYQLNAKHFLSTYDCWSL